jgi:formylglycine-generating enzyme required for sulfatase activity
MSYIFISYSNHNQEYARSLAEKLKQEGFDVWIDDRIDYGDDWELAIFKAIDDCAAFVVVMSPASYESKWVRRECHHAEKRDKPPFPILLEGEEFPRYGITQFFDATDGALPSTDFYNRVEKYAQRQNKPGKEVALRFQIKSTSSTPDNVRSYLQDDLSKIVLPDVSPILPPPFEWCEIPAGKVTIEYSETDHKTFDVPQFWMAKYPLTNAQYQVFVDAQDGYGDPAWWAYSDSAKVWRRDNKRPQKTAFEGDDLPRTNVTWYEAVAFCQWLTARIYPDSSLQARAGVIITLPTEQQWQRTAQGGDKRRFPWGNEFDKTKCNTSESGIERPTPVTQYLGGASPFGVMDMSGNVWEWCQTQHTTGQISLSGREHRVIRGGGWGHVSSYSEVVYRSASYPILKNGLHGFRVCATNPTNLPAQ